MKGYADILVDALKYAELLGSVIEQTKLFK